MWALSLFLGTAFAGDAAIGLRDTPQHPALFESVVLRAGQQGTYVGFEAFASGDLTPQPSPAPKASVQNSAAAANANAFHERGSIGFQARGTLNAPPDFGWYAVPWLALGGEFQGWKHYRYHNFGGGGQVYTNFLGWGMGAGPTASLGVNVGYSKIHFRAEVVDRMLFTTRPDTDGRDLGLHLEHQPTFGVFLGTHFDGQL